MTPSSSSTTTCPSCGFHPPLWAAFCPQCGRELPTADVVQLTDMSGISHEHTLDNVSAYPRSSEAKPPLQATVQISPLTAETFHQMVRQIHEQTSLHPPAPLDPPAPLALDDSPVLSRRQTMMLEPDVLTRVTTSESPGATLTFSADLSPYLLQETPLETPSVTVDEVSPESLVVPSSSLPSPRETLMYERESILAKLPTQFDAGEVALPVAAVKRSSPAQSTMVMDHDNIQSWIQEMGVSLSPEDEKKIEDATATLAEAEHAVDQGEYAKAIDLYLALIRSFPDQTQYQERLAELWAQLREHQPSTEDSQSHAHPSSWLTHVAVFGMLAIIVVLGFLALTRPRPAPPPERPKTNQRPSPPPVSPQFATLQINSLPTGASIRLNDQVLAQTTPTSLQRTQGEYVLILQKEGFRPMQMRIKLQQGQFFAAEFALTPESAAPAPRPTLRKIGPSRPRTPVAPVRNIQFTSKPPGATILLNDRDTKRTTPASMRLRHGEYQVHVRLQGYQSYIRSLRIDEDTDSLFHVNLSIKPPPQEPLLISTIPVGASILIDNKDTGQKTPSTVSVPPQTFTLTLQLAGYRTLTQSIPAGSRRPMQITLTPAGVPGMVWIPAGEFWMGNNAGTEREKPMRKVSLRGYWIDRHEVTVRAYLPCVQAGVCKPTPHQAGCNAHQTNRLDHPINCVSWYDAQTYCRWQKKRLPTEAEWEKAARGTGARLYPWGHASPSCQKAHYQECGNAGTRPVATLSAGRSAYGIYDMAGNVWEWVQDRYDGTFYRKGFDKNPVNLQGTTNYRVIRGGAWDSSPDRLHVTYRADYWSLRRTHTIGFRCAK